MLGNLIQYVGSSVSPATRIAQHRCLGKIEFDWVMMYPCRDVNRLGKLEEHHIRRLRPRLNVFQSARRSKLKNYVPKKSSGRNRSLAKAILLSGRRTYEIARCAKMHYVRLSQIVNGFGTPRDYEITALCRALGTTAGRLGLA